MALFSSPTPRLPGPSRVPAAGSGVSRSLGSSNLNRRSQSFNSIDKSKPLQYASGNDRGRSRFLVPPRKTRSPVCFNSQRAESCQVHSMWVTMDGDADTFSSNRTEVPIKAARSHTRKWAEINAGFINVLHQNLHQTVNKIGQIYTTNIWIWGCKELKPFFNSLI